LLAKHWVLFTIRLTLMIGLGFTLIVAVALQVFPLGSFSDRVMVFVPGVLNVNVGVQLVVLLPSLLKFQLKLEPPIELQLKRIGSPTQGGPEVVIEH